ncbi:zinc finger and BTB domain-containing protein 17 isoform X2 [Orussus abietinus]|uniref:zinc finger and BTB domain-containing protein 17 isoform X2 n=1 Tax=Orussus abietinus TaxID=222816 RepID=UPI000C715FCA|nr:zinc finger and BTB domain-containing protein 17 isoform X2 [Orussus abietinus]
MADPTAERFSLKWNNFSNNLTAGFLSHLTENDLVDVTLAVEGKLLQAHKLVLSVCSPYFKTIFKNIPCQHPVIVLKDMGYADVESLLKFMYQGEVNVKQEDLASFLKVAEVLQIKGLTGDETKCEEEPSEGAVRSSKQKFDIQAEPLNSSPVGDTNVTQSAINNNQLPEASIKVKRSQELDGQVAQSSKKCKMSASSTKELDAPVLSPQAVIAKEEPLEYDDDEDDRTFFVDDQLGHLSESEKTLDEGSTMLVQNDVKEKNRLMFNNLSDAPSVDVDSAVPAKRGGKRSAAWGYFQKIDSHTSRCEMCGKFFKTSSGSTSALLRHLKLHPSFSHNSEFGASAVCAEWPGQSAADPRRSHLHGPLPGGKKDLLEVHLSLGPRSLSGPMPHKDGPSDSLEARPTGPRVSSLYDTVAPSVGEHRVQKRVLGQVVW